MVRKEFVFEEKKYRVRVEHDDHPHSPRDWDNIGEMLCRYPGYNLGDAHITDAEKANAEEMCWEKIGKHTTEGVFEQLALSKDAIFWLPLTVYQHGGITMHIGSKMSWDYSPAGIIYITKEKLVNCYGEDWEGYFKKTDFKNDSYGRQSSHQALTDLNDRADRDTA